jgi:hypothetical protein
MPKLPKHWSKDEHVAYVQACLIATGPEWEKHCQYALHLERLAYYQLSHPAIVAEAERTLPDFLERAA